METFEVEYYIRWVVLNLFNISIDDGRVVSVVNGSETCVGSTRQKINKSKKYTGSLDHLNWWSCESNSLDDWLRSDPILKRLYLDVDWEQILILQFHSRQE